MVVWRWLRFFLACFAVLFLVLIAGVGWLLSGQRYQAFLADQLGAWLQAQIKITKSEFSLKHGLGLRLQGVEIQSEGTTAPTLLVEQVTVLLDLRALLRGQLLFHRVEWEKPHISLAESATNPFVFLSSVPKDGEPAPASMVSPQGWWTPTLALRMVKIIDGEVFYRHKKHAVPFALTRTNMMLLLMPDRRIQVQFEATLGAKGEWGRIMLHTTLPWWEGIHELAQLSWSGKLHCERLRLRELGRQFGSDWPMTTLAFDGQAEGKGLVLQNLTGVIHMEQAAFGAVQVHNGTVTLRKFVIPAEPTPSQPWTWKTLLQTALAEVEVQEVRASVKGHASQLLFSTGTGVLREGELTLTDASGKLGERSRLLAVNGVLKQLTAPKGPVPDLVVKAEVQAEEDLSNLLESLVKMKLLAVPPQVRQFHGSARIDMAVRAPASGGPLSTNGSIQFHEVGFVLPTFKTEVRGVTGTITMSDTSLVLDTIALQVGFSTLQVTGQIGAYRSKRPQATLTLTAEVELSELATLVALGEWCWPTFAVVHGEKLSQLVTNPQGRAAVHLELQRPGSSAATTLSGSVSFHAVALQVPHWNLSVTQLSGAVQLEKDTILTDGVTFQIGNASLRAQGALHDYLTAQRTGEIRVAFSEVSDAEVSTLLPQLIHPQGGVVSGLVALVFLSNTPLQTRGEVTLSGVRIDPLPKVLHAFTVEEGELTWEGQSGVVAITRGSVRGTVFHGQGRIWSFVPLNIEAKLNIPVFAFESVFRLEEQPSKVEHTPKDETVNVRVDVTAEHLTYKKFHAEQVRASCYWHGRQADMHVASAKMAGGEVQGDAVFWPDFNGLFVTPTLTAVQAPSLLAALELSTDMLTGTLSKGGAIYIPNRHQWRDMALWQAHLSLEMNDGIAQHIPLLVRLWSAVSFQAVLKLQLPNLPNGGFSFSSLSGDFAVGGGRIVTKNLSLQSPAVRLDADGAVNLVGQTLDLKVTLAPLHGITSSVAKVPLAGQVIARGAEMLTTLPFRVSGPYHEPTVMPLVIDLGSQ